MSVWNYVVTAQKPTNVTHSVVGNFTASNELNLIIAKCTRLEVHLLTPQGLKGILDMPIYGRIATLELFRPPGESKDVLFLSTERYKFCVIEYDAETNTLQTRAMGDVSDRIGRPTDNGQLGIVDPDFRLIGLHLYDGLFKVIPIDSKGTLKEAFNIRLEELQVIDIKFLYGCEKPTIAVLYQDTKEARHIKTYTVLLREKDFGDGPWAQSNLDSGAGLIVPVPMPLGGAIIVGEQTVVYHNGSIFKAIAMPMACVTSFGRVDADGSRYLLGDHMGMMHLLALVHDKDRVLDLKIEALGETSAASTISYLDNGFVYVGSSFGDSQLVKLRAHPDESGSYVEIVDTFLNLGPIVDLCIVDLEQQGQGQVVTCSGALKDGSLRIVRNGIGINEQSTVELLGIKGMWSLRQSTAAVHDAYLVVTFIRETRILGINESTDEMEEVEIAGFDSEAQSLYCGNAGDTSIVQVTSSRMNLVDATSFQLLSHWLAPPSVSVNCAAGNPTQLLLATGGGNLIYFEVEGQALVEKRHVQLEHEIACVDVSPLRVGGVGGERAHLAAVGLWTDLTLRVFRLPDLQLVHKEPLGGSIIPRSVLFCTFEEVPYLLCALGDGHLLNFVVDPPSGALSERKNVLLGTQPIALKPFQAKNTTHVFAASDHPTVIYSGNKKLLYSNVNLKEVIHICPFNTAAFPDSLALAKEGELTIGTIDDIQKLHIRTVPLKEQPRRICHHEKSRTLAVVTQKYSMATDEDIYFVRLFSDQTFDQLHSITLDPYETGVSIMTCTFADDPTPYVVLGTGYALPEEPEPTKGRILVMAVEQGRLQRVAEKETKGAVYNLNAFNGKLLAGINQKLQLFRWVQREDGTRELQAECGHHGHVLALYVKCRGDFIVVGDLMKSMSLLMYKPEEGAIEERARDFNANWMTAVEVLDDDTYLGAENSFNLITVRKNSDAASDEERGRLEVAGEYHLGEFVNTFRHGSLVMRLPDTDTAEIPTVIFGTVNGVIGVVASLPQELFAFLHRLQGALTKTVQGVGGLQHDEWRSFANERKTAEARNFIDGDLIESFLDLPRPKMQEVADRLALPLEDITKRVEELTRLH